MIVAEKNANKLNDILNDLITNEILYNPEGIAIGHIENIEILDRKNREGQEFNQIQLNVKSSDGKTYNKRYSTDFIRKFLLQLGIKAAELPGKTVIFKPTKQYKNIGFFAFVIWIQDGEEGDGVYDIQAYENNDIGDITERLKKLGL